MASGILNVNKPAGQTSFAAVRQVQRLPGVRKVGHGGTLDPAADGVLPVLINAATRLADFVHAWPKEYLATVTFGATSDTGDAEGRVTPQGDAGSITSERIEAVLPSFVGFIEQVPPAYSALKQGGESLYRKARRGELVEPAARRVEIHSLTLLEYEPSSASARLAVRCGRGTYIRSLARDLGAALGCGAYLSALTRTAVGPLRLADAITPAHLQQLGERWAETLLAMELPIQHWPALELDSEGAELVRQGRRLPAPASPAERYRLLDPQGGLIGWAEVVDGFVQPRAVLAP